MQPQRKGTGCENTDFQWTNGEIHCKINNSQSFLLILQLDWYSPFQDILEKKKRYAYLVVENVGNFQECTRIA